MSDGYCEVDFGSLGEDADPVEFLDTIIVKRARKAHTCSECGGEIAKGETYQRRSYRFDGKFEFERVCLACKEVAGEFEFTLCGGVLWSFFSEEWAGGARLQACLDRLTTVKAKETMRAQWQKWQERRLERLQRLKRERLQREQKSE